MDVILASALAPILRSGFELSYVLVQMERLDVPTKVSEKFLQLLVSRGACHFGEPDYYHNPVLRATPHKDVVVIQSQYSKRPLFISSSTFSCLHLLDKTMPRETYEKKLGEHLRSRDLVDKVCQSLAQYGLLLSSSLSQPSPCDYGTLRWSFEITIDGELLDSGAWEKRLDFLQESFRGSFFQSRNFFGQSPICLRGDFKTIVQKASPAYFWDLSFKLQSFARLIPVVIRLSLPVRDKGFDMLRIESPSLFRWDITVDLRGGDERTVEELIEFSSKQRFSQDQTITLLLNRQAPSRLAEISKSARLNLYYANLTEDLIRHEIPAPLHQATQRFLCHFLSREGCGAASSLYVDGRGDVYTCPLDGACCIGNIDSGAESIEQQRQRLRKQHAGACDFGVNAGDLGCRGVIDEFAQKNRDSIAEQWSFRDFACP